MTAPALEGVALAEKVARIMWGKPNYSYGKGAFGWLVDKKIRIVAPFRHQDEFRPQDDRNHAAELMSLAREKWPGSNWYMLQGPDGKEEWSLEMRAINREFVGIGDGCMAICAAVILAAEALAAK